jgi:glycosyltransferase involved in cell wall biosynthesis
LCEGLIAARAANVPIVVHGEHGTMETRPRNRFVQRWVWNRVDRVLSVSSRLAEKMAREIRFPLEHITVIRNGVDLARFQTGNRLGGRQALGLEASDFVIGTVGRLVPVKDQATLLEDIALVRREIGTCKAVIVGDGPLDAPLKRQATQLGIADCVVFTGHRHDVQDLLAAFDLFVLSSSSEGLSNVILEAMACSLPVVATDVGGSGELVDQARTGLLVEPGSPAALSAALITLGRDPQRRQAMALAARDRVEREFALEKMIQRYQQLYLEVGRQDYFPSRHEPREA